MWQLDEAHRIGIDAGFLTIDEARGHVTPRAAGATDDERNLVAACRECKSRKGAS